MLIKIISKFISLGMCIKVIDYKLKNVGIKELLMDGNVHIKFEVRDKVEKPKAKKTKAKKKETK